MTLVLLLLFVFSLCSAGADSVQPDCRQLVRTRWDYGEDSSVLYRLEDREALAEISFRRTQGGDVLPERFILETDFISFGSFTPAGMWKFIDLDTLISPSELRDTAGVRADRSSVSSLNHPLASFRKPGFGGAYIQASEEQLNCALWGDFDLGGYRNLQAGLSVSKPDSSVDDPAEEGWFEDVGDSQYSPVCHIVSDYRQEFGSSRFSLTVALSAARDRVAGFSILPAFDLYGSFVDWSIRFWYNSPSWINGSCEHPAYMEVWENSFRFFPARGLRIGLEWEAALDRNKESPAAHTFDLDSVYGAGKWEFEAAYSVSPPSEEEFLYLHRWRGGVSRRGPVIVLQAEGGAEADREGFTELFASASARLRLGVSTTRILLDYSSVPGELILKPVLEETLSLGQFRLKGRASVELRAPGITVIDPDTIVITLAAEWRIWDSAE